MSRTRRRQSLGGTDRLRQDPVPEFGAQASARDEIYLALQEALEPFLDLEQVEEAHGPF
jgi:hypothetical protein